MTGTEVYNYALILADANQDQDKSDYESKALWLINGLQGELYQYSRNYDPNVPSPVFLTALSDSFVSLDDYLAYTVLGHGLAAYFLMSEDPSTGNTLLQRYQELRADRQRGIGNPASGSVEIEDVTGETNYYNRFTRWS